MPTIYLETLIKATPKDCFQLCLNVDLHQISTKQTSETIVGGIRQGRLTLGDTVTWKAKHFGIWQYLTVQITQEEPFSYFCDEMLKGTFKSMKHEHLFEVKGDETLMKDIFHFESPFGILGEFVNWLFLTNYMEKFLIERNRLIQTVAESSEKGKFLS